MANRHYAEIGDVWKHLPLAEILSIEKPELYWESHAGSSHYPLTRSPARDYGVLHFLTHSEDDPVLARSAYRRLLARYEQEKIYPGSPLIAMGQLGSRTAEFLFCDLDRDSLDTIEVDARELGLDAVETVERDGVEALTHHLQSLPDSDTHATLVHIDPYDPCHRRMDQTP